MTIGEFALAVKDLVEPYGGSVTSWGRSNKHAIAVGGFAFDPHTWFLGADIVYDGDVKPDQSAAALRGLKLIREGSHDHLQPLDMPAGPVHTYGGVTRV